MDCLAGIFSPSRLARSQAAETHVQDRRGAPCEIVWIHTYAEAYCRRIGAAARSPRLAAYQAGRPQMNDRTAELEAAVRAQDALIAEAQRLLTDYLSKRTESAELTNNLLGLFDGSQQREA